MGFFDSFLNLTAQMFYFKWNRCHFLQFKNQEIYIHSVQFHVLLYFGLPCFFT